MCRCVCAFGWVGGWVCGWVGGCVCVWVYVCDEDDKLTMVERLKMPGMCVQAVLSSLCPNILVTLPSHELIYHTYIAHIVTCA